jgi:DNA adenine methylase
MGNKRRIAKQIQKFFPKHDIYIEPFFGAGGMFFNKPKAKYNFLNDLDDDVYNLYRQLIDNKEELVKLIEITPISEVQFKEWAKGKREASPILNAVRFIFLSNFGLYGDPSTLRIGVSNAKNIILERIEKTFKYLSDVYFLNTDFRDLFVKICIRRETDLKRAFCYCDPPYLGTNNNYSTKIFTEEDSFDLFETLQASKMRWAMSEFNHDFIISEAKRRGLIVNYIGERQNLKNRRIEVLVTNYEIPQLQLFTE